MSSSVAAALLRAYTTGSLPVVGLRDALWEQVWGWAPSIGAPPTADLITDWRAALDVQLLLVLEPFDVRLAAEPKGCAFDSAAVPCVRCRHYFDGLDRAVVEAALDLVHALPARAAASMAVRP